MPSVNRSAAVERRLSADDLRRLGVDETFLMQAPCLDLAADDVDESDAESGHTSGPCFVVGQSRTHLEFGTACVQDASQGIADEPEWPVEKMEAKYGLGYKLLAGMGYQGGGPVPLAAIKRKTRVGLQDDEDVARDPHFTSKRRRGQRKRQVVVPDGQLVEGPVSSQEADSDFSSDESESDPLARLRCRILQELRAAIDNRLAISALIRQPRIRFLLSGPLKVSIDSQMFLRRFVRHHMPQCRVKRSLASAWRGLNGSKSQVSWARASSTDFFVALDDNSAGGSDSSCSSPQSDVDIERLREEADAAVSEQSGPTCHGCGFKFASPQRLRQHLLEKLSARTTRDPTNLTAQFDPTHSDREVLDAASAAHCKAPRSWKCSVCNWTASSLNFTPLLQHAFDEPSRRLKHQRLCEVIAEVLLREVPPAALVLQPTASTWCSRSLARLFDALTSGAAAHDYASLEEAVLGPEEEDMFSGLLDADTGQQDDSHCFENPLPVKFGGSESSMRNHFKQLYGTDVPERPD
jgi:hypothetical protein